MVNVPTTDWYCDRCRNIHDAARQSYTSLLAELEKDPSAAMKFLEHNFSAAEFYKKHADGLALFGPETAPHIRRKTLGSSKSKATAQIGVRKNLLDFFWQINQGLNGREFWLVGIKGDPKVVTWISSPCRFEPRLA